MQRIKRILAVFLVAMTLLSCNVTGFAAKKPTVASKAYASSWTIKRGSSIKIRFVVNSNSYTYKNGRYRTVFYTELYYKNLKNFVRNSGRIAGVNGRKNVYVTYSMSSRTATGTYLVANAAFCHKTGTKNPVKTNLSKWTMATKLRAVDFYVY